MDNLRPISPDTAGGDFKLIYLEFQPKILRYITNMVGEFDAEDVIQEIFT